MMKSSEKPTNIFPLALVTLIGLFLINILGFIDTQTGSALGCGRDWPLCKGEIIPTEWDLHTAIEFIHRLTVLIDLVLSKEKIYGSGAFTPFFSLFCKCSVVLCLL